VSKQRYHSTDEWKAPVIMALSLLMLRKMSYRTWRRIAAKIRDSTQIQGYIR